ncbi:MAG: DUF4382 domain-containing protein [Cyanobacteria bacterium P01_D01_bin.105]
MSLHRFFRLVPIALMLIGGCSQGRNVDESAQVDAAPGTLVVTANGEDFVRQGFTSKDGWRIDFENVYVTLADITAYQADPAFEPEKQTQPTAKASVDVSESITVDLAAGDADADPVVVVSIDDAPGGRYNALSWRMGPAESGPSAGYSIMMVGTAIKENDAVDFQLQLDERLGFVCGDFIGDVRKGILSGGQTADVEATFHFDHLFGDGDAPAEDEINTGALGFEPVAMLAENGEVSLTSDELQQNLNKEDYEILQALLPSLGHVGEGHCEETLLD